MRVKVPPEENWEDAWSKETDNTFTLTYPCICRKLKNFNSGKNSTFGAQTMSNFLFYSTLINIQPKFFFEGSETIAGLLRGIKVR